MSRSDVCKTSLVELRSRCEAVIESRQEHVRKRQDALRAFEPEEDATHAIAEVLRRAADDPDPKPILEAAVRLVRQGEDSALLAELAESAAQSLDAVLDEIARPMGGVSALDYSVSVLFEMGRKAAVSRASGGQRNYVDSAIDRSMDATKQSIIQSLALIRDTFADAGVTQACEQLSSDLDEYVAAVLATEAA